MTTGVLVWCTATYICGIRVRPQNIRSEYVANKPLTTTTVSQNKSLKTLRHIHNDTRPGSPRHYHRVCRCGAGLWLKLSCTLPKRSGARGDIGYIRVHACAEYSDRSLSQIRLTCDSDVANMLRNKKRGQTRARYIYKRTTSQTDFFTHKKPPKPKRTCILSVKQRTGPFLSEP